MPITNVAKHAGFTIIELLVALSINILLFTALLTVFTANVSHYSKSLNIDTLNQQLQSALLIMSSDIRRAGYWANAQNDAGTDQNNNPFMTATTDIQTSGACILFTYDDNSNGTLPSISASYDDERYGYRLNGGILQARPPGALFSCAAGASNWENITNSSVLTITALTFTLNTQTLSTGSGTKSIAIRSVDISITGQLVNDTTITKTLTEHVRVRNDKFIP
jgi:prepilin peptidase dependent protein B